jgi:hypothetical protein
MKVPMIIASSILCLVIGLGVGLLAGIFVGPKMPSWLGGPTEQVGDNGKAPEADGNGPVARMPPMGPPKGGMPPMGGFPGKGGGGAPKGPTAKTQLSNLVTKLDALTEKPLTVTLDADQKKQIAEQLKGLDGMEELSEEEAKQRLDAILSVLKDQKRPLEATGFSWPGAGGGGGGGGGFGQPQPPNPFKVEANGKHLQSLQERLEKPAS